MLIPAKVIKGLAKTASKDQMRYQLCGIHVERNGTSEAVSTNGKILGHCQWKEADQDEFPSISGDIGTDERRPEKFAFTIPTEDAMAMAKIADSPVSKNKPILGNVAIKENDTLESTTLHATDLDSVATRKVENKGDFPDYHCVKDLFEGNAISRIDVSLLKQACEAIIAIHGKDAIADVLYVEASKPLGLQVTNEEMKTTVMVMPLVKS